jgi:hypothetical protein
MNISNRKGQKRKRTRFMAYKKIQTYWSNSISNLSSKPGPKYSCSAWPSTLLSSLDEESEVL